MRDAQLFTLLKSIIEAAEPNYGIPKVDGEPGVAVAQNYQPTQQGVASLPTAYLEIIGYQWIGQPRREDYWDQAAGKEIQRQTQQMQTQFQLSSLATQDPNALNQYSAGDIVQLIGMILQGTDTIALLEAQGCGIVREKTTRNPKFVNDKGRFEANPSLDFGITHKVIVSMAEPVVSSTELDIYVV